METILNDKSKLYNKITIDTLINFIKVNLSSFQPASEVITVENTKPIKSTKTEKSIPKQIDTKTFYDKLKEPLIDSKYNILFSPNFFKKLPNFSLETDLFLLNLNCPFIDIETTSEDSKKKTDYTKYTFFKSVLYNLIESKLNETEMDTFMKTLIKHISYGGITEFGYGKLKWNKKTLKDNITKNIIDSSTVRIVCDYLHINIFIINEDTDNFEYGGGEFIPFKKNIFLYKYSDIYYPVFNKSSTIFPFTDDLMKYFLKNTELITLLSHDQISFKEEDLSKYINLSTILPEITIPVKVEEISVINKFDDSYSEDENAETETETESESEAKVEAEAEAENDIIFVKYMKLSLMEIQKEAKKHNISIKNDTKLKNKKDLCMEIIKVKKHI